jgi:hypothetical protein
MLSLARIQKQKSEQAEQLPRGEDACGSTASMGWELLEMIHMLNFISVFRIQFNMGGRWQGEEE